MISVLYCILLRASSNSLSLSSSLDKAVTCIGLYSEVPQFDFRDRHLSLDGLKEALKGFGMI